MKRIAILGATGSIGTQTLSVISSQSTRFRAEVLVARHNVAAMKELIIVHRPSVAIMTDAQAAKQLAHDIQALGGEIARTTRIASGMDEVLHAVAMPEVDAVMGAMVGAIGIAPIVRAIIAKKTIYLANKESMVVAGSAINQLLHQHGGTLLPIDSEHNALFQCLPWQHHTQPLIDQGVRQLWLTASGGPFRGRNLESLHNITPEEAIAHPRWKMGKKISVDSATLMNKGLEVIEAHFLYRLPPDRLAVVVHPQSVVHSMVEYIDGSFLAQLSTPDMRTPIAHALGYPERIEAPITPMNPLTLGSLDFSAPDINAFPCLGLAYKALQQGGTAPLVLNAANEIAVDAFLNARCGFTDIAKINEWALSRFAQSTELSSIDDIIDEDSRIRAHAQEIIARHH